MNIPRSILFFFFLICLQQVLQAQPQTREELERQRQQLRREIEQTEQLLDANKKQTKESLLQWRLVNNKVNLQDRVIDNINRDLNLLSNDIYTTQLDIRRYDRVLDTLKQEYAKSMVYAYKNRGNYDFLNFILSASSFNDAIKRIAYLRSYHNYREVQGENILRTQELRRQKIRELNAMRLSKTATLDVKSQEMKELELQKREKDRILAELKKQGKSLNKEIASKQKQMQKVNNAIAAAIARAQREAREAALAAEKKRREAEARAVATVPAGAKGAEPKAAPAPKPKPAEPARASILLNDANAALNTNFENNRGSLPWPVDRGLVIMHYGSNRLPSGAVMVVTCVSISSDIGNTVKAVFDGTVSSVTTIDDIQVVIIQHGRYFTTYSNLDGASVAKGQQIKTGQAIGRVAANFDGVGAIDFYISNENANYDPESWLRRR
jgi:hypothetical protein